MKNIFIIVIASIFYFSNAFAVTLLDALNQTYQNNIQLNAERENIKASEEDVNIAKSDYKPSLTLSGSQSFEDTNKLTNQSGGNATISDLTFTENRGGWVFDDAEHRYTIGLVAIEKISPGNDAVVSVRGPYNSFSAYSAGLQGGAVRIPVSVILGGSDAVAIPLLPTHDIDNALTAMAQMRTHPRFDTDIPGEFRFRPTTDFHAAKDRPLMIVEGNPPSNSWPVYGGKSFDIWNSIIEKRKIIFGSKKDNFWEMGETGPCGPCSEVHIDLRTEKEIKKVPTKSLVNKDHPEVIEIWNLVFIQYNRKSNGNLEPLPLKHVDTGMGLERLSMALKGVKSTYEIEIFKSIMVDISKISEILDPYALVS